MSVTLENIESVETLEIRQDEKDRALRESRSRLPLTIERIRNKEIQVAVIGMGYVGFPLSLIFAEAGVKALGFDVDISKVDNINAGASYISHINSDRLKVVLEKGLIAATTDLKCIEDCDAVIICVPTPLTHHLEPDLHYIEETLASIASHLKPHTLVSLESTTWPGTTKEVVVPILESKSALRTGKDLYVSFSPEREDPGNKSFGTRNIPKLVGGYDKKSLELATALYETAVQEVVPVSSTSVAESAKLFENIFRSVNIALVNELKVIFDKMDVDVWEVIKAAETKPFGFMPFSPGPGLGGHCIPIDPFYLTWKAKEYGVRTRFIELAGEINRSMPKWVLAKIQDCLNSYSKAMKGSKVLILGLAYKSDVEDMRESPSLELIKLMEEKGATVDYYDTMIPEIPSSREYAYLAGRKSSLPSDEYDCFVLSTVHTSFSAEQFMSYGVPIVDTRNFFPKHERVFPA
jgi:UDP-N-acetyl-D-glucosamine dehydrogenase